MDGRMFIGYDAGRPVEIDPVTLDYVTAVGANGEWFQALPGLLEPLVAVAAHPATDFAEHAMYFLNYTQVNPPGKPAESYLARWDLEGEIQRWRLGGMSEFDSIHDVKVTENHVVFTDLPFVFEPETMRGAPRTRRNQDDTKIWIVAKKDLDDTPVGGTVAVTEVRVPMPTGHIFADYEEADGRLRLTLQQIPLSDLMVTMRRSSTAHGTGRSMDPNYEGLIALALQPSIVTSTLIDPSSGEVIEKRSAVDEKSVWGGILCTTDTTHPEAVRRLRQVWCAGIGFDPDLVPQEWWDLYGDATDGLVAPADLPTEAVPGSLARLDLDLMDVVDVYTYAPGSFPSPPTFVPRVGSQGPEDGYVVVVVHQDGPKEVQVFDAGAVGAGPIARAGSPTFNPGLLLHSCWMADRRGPRPSSYRVPLGRDVLGAVAGIPKVIWSMVRLGRGLVASRSEVNSVYPRGSNSDTAQGAS